MAKTGGFTLLWSGMLKSSLWVRYDSPTRIVWFTLLLMKDADGLVHTSDPAVIAHEANVGIEETEKALALFLSPDSRSHLKNDEGRRLREVEGGLQIINHEHYRYSSEATRLYWSTKKAEQRKKDARKEELAKQGRKREPRGKVRPTSNRTPAERQYEKDNTV